MPQMEAKPECYEKTTATDLYRLINKFINDNEHHRDIEYRWLAEQAIELKNMTHSLGINGSTSFSSKYQKEIAAFRLLEIEEEREKLSKADARLADEAKKLATKAA